MFRDALRPNSFAPNDSVSNGAADNDSELLELLKGLSGESGRRIAPEVFSEKLDRLGLLLARHIDTEEQHAGASHLSASCSQSHIQEHNLMLEQYVQWQFELMKMNSSPRAEICAKIEEWLACHVFAFGAVCPDGEAGAKD